MTKTKNKIKKKQTKKQIKKQTKKQTKKYFFNVKKKSSRSKQKSLRARGKGRRPLVPSGPAPAQVTDGGSQAALTEREVPWLSCAP